MVQRRFRAGSPRRVPWCVLGCAAMLVALISTSATLAHGLANSVAFTDGRGDAVALKPETADRPDITRVVVSNDVEGLVTFRISLLERPVLRDDMRFHILIDTDHDRTTGNIPGGFENILRWEARCGGLCNAFPSMEFHYEPNVAVLTFSVRPEANSGNPALSTRRFRFAVAVETGIVYDPRTGTLDFGNASWDVAPDQTGPCAASPLPLVDSPCPVWDYGVRYGPARLVAKELTVSPARPVAGSRLTVALAAARTDTGEPAVRGRVLCKASVATGALRAHVQRFVGGRPTCAFVVPRGARGLRLTGSITVVADGLVLTRTFARRVD